MLCSSGTYRLQAAYKADHQEPAGMSYSVLQSSLMQGKLAHVESSHCMQIF